MGHSLRLATWNVNSIRTRLPRVLDWLDRGNIDVLAMQETKCTNQQFPFADFEARGYQVAHVGLNQWNGVAIASRVGLEDIEIGFPNQPGFAKPDQEPVVEARAIGATCAGIRVWSLYVPNGRTLEDPHYRYKLEWLRNLGQAATHWLMTDPQQPLVLMGDWNIAPYDTDVWDMNAFRGSTHVSEAERTAFQEILNIGLQDLVRPFTESQEIYTFWDYKQLCFPKNHGMRIDFILGSDCLSQQVIHAEIVRDERKGQQPSDHAPAFIELTSA